MSEPAPRAERKTPPTPIPFTVLTGFLGAGKTTLLSRLLKDPALADTAVVINEFGEVGLDHLLVEYVSDNIVLLQSGCLCCTMRGDLVDALETLLRDPDNRRRTFKRLLLGNTGLAGPGPGARNAAVPIQAAGARPRGPRRSGAGAASCDVAPLSRLTLSSGRRHNRRGCRRR